MDSVVPVPPPGVCFVRERFTLPIFSADIFLQELWNTVPLEVLRDDLGSYLKVLRSAMIELINRDYADFVNLSGNLVGLDVAISNLQHPLSSMHVEIQIVEKVLHEAHSKLQITLCERQCLREQKLLLECLMKMPTSLENLENLLLLLKMTTTSDGLLEVGPAQGNLIGRAANEFNNLQHLLLKSSCTDGNLNERIAKVKSDLMKYLENALFCGIENHNRDLLQRSLHSFVILDQRKLAMNLVRIRLVRPTFQKILNQTSLKKEPQDLDGLLVKIKDNVWHMFTNLIEVCKSCENLREFDFAVDCIWPEFCDSLVCDLDCIFAQGNPDLFHKRYTSIMTFIDHLEIMSNSTNIHPLRIDKNYHLLLTRWNLPVYFQMRFQDIAGSVELSLIAPFSEFKEDNSLRNFRSTDVLLSALISCFSADVYIAPLAHRFWKLTLQIMARYTKKVKEILSDQLKCYEVLNSGTPAVPLSQSSSSARLTDMDSSVPVNHKKITLHQLVLLNRDVHLILEELPKIWATAWKRLSDDLDTLKECTYEKSFNSCSEDFRTVLLPKIKQLIVSELSSQCIGHLKHVSDIPRLYRRTNKEVPTKPSTYVNQLLTALQDFHRSHANQEVNPEVWIGEALKILSQQYLVSVSDVLTSVQKTEESLKRLRKDRSAVTSTSHGISDDDKIRIQLVIDVDSFVSGARLLLAVSVNSPELQALIDAVEHARQVHDKSTLGAL